MSTTPSHPERHESRTSQTFTFFVRDLVSTGGFESVEEAVRAASVVLTCLEQRLTAEEAEDLNAQLPIKLKEMLQDVKRPEIGKPVVRMHKKEFLQAISSTLGIDDTSAETIARNVFMTLRAHISEGEARDVASQLPLDLKPLWAEPI